MKEDKTKNIPRTNIDRLPSHFKPYPDGLSFQTRPYTIGESRALAGDLTTAEVFKIILSGVYVSGGKFDRLQFTLEDLAYISLIRKVLTIGDRGTVTISMEKDKVEYSRILKFQELEFAEMEAQAVPITVDVLGGRTDVVFRPVTIAGYLKSLTYREKFPKDDDVVRMYAAMLGNFETDIEYQENVAFIQDLAGEDRNIVERIDRLFSHGIKDVEIQTADGKVCVNVKLTDENLQFFRPTGGDADGLGHRLRFG